MRQKAAKFKQIYAFAAGKFDSQARLIARQISFAGAKFDEILNLMRATQPSLP
ncbi:hypothetical protein [Campylobacter showae]|uniref:hypothetical protein n=1 Tax=Campylobacter showae TaxID=204 RepID=UPI00034A230E|nr:hypothetical protein [Campylobacter showae]